MEGANLLENLQLSGDFNYYFWLPILVVGEKAAVPVS